MKKLEHKILAQIYSYETKRTLVEIIIRTISLVTVGAMLIVLIESLIRQLVYQQTLDLFQLFGENWDTVQENMRDILETLYYEIPQHQVFTIVLCAVFLFLFLLAFLNNQKRINNNIKSLIKYWKRHTK